MSKTTKKPMPPPKRITITMPSVVVRELLDERHRRQLSGETISLAGVVVEHLERVYGVADGAS